MSTALKEDNKLKELLENLDCLSLYETFLKEEITANLVLTLDKDDLVGMGIRVGGQKRFLQAKQKYEEECRITKQHKSGGK